MSEILVVDDEPGVVQAFAEVLAESGHKVTAERQASAALERLNQEAIDLVIMDVCMPGMDGLEALDRIKRHQPKLPVIIMTGQGTMETAIEATKRGAFDYQLKPFEPEEMLEVVDRALECARITQRRVALGADRPSASGDAIIGQSAALQEVYKAIGRVAATDVTVLIRGESGTGKELVARAIYQYGQRSGGLLLVVNCAAIPETLLEGELFGYERGAFTGATSRRIGKFEQADGGTIFLDEIGDVPLSIQAKILRVLQEKTFERLGSNDTLFADVRVVAATNRNLEKAIAEGEFRADLFHRLNVVTIHIPSLRERREDIPRLVDYFLERFAGEMKIDKPLVAEDAMRRLETYPWPGNVRELEHCIHRALIFTQGYPIQATALPLADSGTGESSTPGKGPLSDEELLVMVQRHLDAQQGPGTHEQLLERMERLLLLESLRRARGNRASAARLLGLPRGTLHTKLNKYGLDNAATAKVP